MARILSGYGAVPPWSGEFREKDLNLQLLGSEPSVLPVELSLRSKSEVGERLESNQQPEAYEASALPLSYAPDFLYPRAGIEPAIGRLRGDCSAR
jgi:hypothetical protein